MNAIDHPHRSHWKHALGVISLFVLVTVGVLWAWNTVLADLLSWPEIKFKHALAIVLLWSLAALAARGRRRHRD